MGRKAITAGDELTARLDSFRQPLYLLAHHDDEVPTGGLLQRLGQRTQVVWVTNSDGLYYEGTLTPKEYGELRKAEGLVSVGAAGVPAANTRCLDFSEVEIYRRMAMLTKKAPMEEVKPFFDEIREAVRKAVFDIRPDVVFTLAWQGGQPEHDLTHFFTRLAVADLERETGKKIEMFHMPAYEYTILISFRFNPLYRGERVRLRLTKEELERKFRMVEAYPSQIRLINDFRKVFKYLGAVTSLFGGPRTAEDFFAVEEFGPIPAIDYARKPHVLDWLTYMFDDFEGTPVTFKGSVRPVVKAFS